MKENVKENHPNWRPYRIAGHSYRILLNGDFGSAKTNSLFNLINQRPDTDKIYWCAKDPYEERFQFLLNKRESTDLRHFNDCKAFIEYSKDIDDNLPLSVQRQLSENLKTFSEFFIAVLECTLNLDNFEKKMSLIAQVFLKLLTVKDVLT